MNTDARAMQLFSAEVLGTLAFKEGRKCVPCLDPEMLKLLEGSKVGEGIEPLKRWIRGWTLANMAQDWN